MEAVNYLKIQTWIHRVVKSGTGDPLFVAKDVCSALGFEKPRNAVAQHVDKEDALKQGILTPGGEQRMTCLRESGSICFDIRL